MTTKLTHLLFQLGPLRLILFALSILALLVTPNPGAQVHYDTLGFLYTVVMPVTTPMIFMLLLLDALMSRIFMSDTQDSVEKQRFKRILIINLSLLILLSVVWYPFYAAIGR